MVHRARDVRARVARHAVPGGADRVARHEVGADREWVAGCVRPRAQACRRDRRVIDGGTIVSPDAVEVGIQSPCTTAASRRRDSWCCSSTAPALRMQTARSRRPRSPVGQPGRLPHSRFRGSMSRRRGSSQVSGSSPPSSIVPPLTGTVRHSRLRRRDRRAVVASYAVYSTLRSDARLRPDVRRVARALGPLAHARRGERREVDRVSTACREPSNTVHVPARCDAGLRPDANRVAGGWFHFRLGVLDSALDDLVARGAA